MKRPTYGANDGQYTTTVITGLKVYIQPRKDGMESSYQAPLYKEFLMLSVGATDLKEGDKIIDQLSREFLVKGTEVFRDLTGTTTKSIIELQ